MRIALVTATGVDTETLDDRFLAEALRVEHGVDILNPRWDEPCLSEADWASFDAVCLRSCWDYHLRYDEFIDWFTRVDRAGVRWINPAAGMRWNSHKRYLIDLQQAGEQGRFAFPEPQSRLHVSSGERRNHLSRDCRVPAAGTVLDIQIENDFLLIRDARCHVDLHADRPVVV